MATATAMLGFRLVGRALARVGSMKNIGIVPSFKIGHVGLFGLRFNVEIQITNPEQVQHPQTLHPEPRPLNLKPEFLQPPKRGESLPLPLRSRCVCPSTRRPGRFRPPWLGA